MGSPNSAGPPRVSPARELCPRNLPLNRSPSTQDCESCSPNDRLHAFSNVRNLDPVSRSERLQALSHLDIAFHIIVLFFCLRLILLFHSSAGDLKSLFKKFAHGVPSGFYCDFALSTPPAPYVLVFSIVLGKDCRLSYRHTRFLTVMYSWLGSQFPSPPFPFCADARWGWEPKFV